MRPIRLMFSHFTATRRRKALALVLSVLLVLFSIRIWDFLSPPPARADSLLSFDEGYGTTVNDSSGSASGTITGATWQTSDLCRREKCLFFDGSDWISFGDEATYDFAAATDFTIQFWFRHAPATAAEVIIQKYASTDGAPTDGGYRIRMESDGDISFGVDDGDDNFADDNITSTAANYDDNRWHHVSAVKDGTTAIYLYIDAVQVASDSTIGSTGTLVNDDTFYIGDSDGTDNADEFIGFLDEVKIYTSTARTQAEINADFLQSNPDRGTSASFSPDTSFLSDGLVGYWKMDETTANSCGTNDSCDSSGNSRDAAWTGNTAPVAAKFGNGTDYDGTGDYTSVSYNSSNVTSFSYGAWFKLDSLTGTKGILSWADNDATDGNPYFLVNHSGAATNRLSFFVYGTGYVESSITLTTGRWYHVFTTNSTSNLWSFYLDGALLSQFQSSAANPNRPTLFFGSGYNGSIDGQVDDVRLYNRALSSSEVADLYNFAPGPVGHWKFDDNTGTGADAIKDTSGNAYHGTTNGSITESDWVPGRIGSGLNMVRADSDYINIPTENANFSINNYTITAWVYRTSDSGGGEVVFDNRDAEGVGFSLEINPGDNYLCLYNATSLLGGAADDLPVDAWTHLACSADGTTIRLYANGIQKGSTAQSGSISETTDATIGATSYTPGQYFPGIIDDVRFYNYGRTAAQVIEDMNAGHPAPGSPVGSAISYWKFDEGSLNTCSSLVDDFCDSASSANDLRFSGTTGGYTSSGKFGSAFDGDGSVWAFRDDDSDFDFTDDEDFTLAGWFNHSAASAQEVILQKFESTGADGGYVVRMESDGDITFGTDNDNSGFPTDSVTSTAATYDDSAWHHFAAVKENTTSLTLYIDGISVGTSSVTETGGTLANNDTLYIADSNGSDGTDEFNGDIDELMIFRSALTASQIGVLFNHASSSVWGNKSTTSGGAADDSTARSYCPPGDTASTCAPIAHYAMNENTGQNVFNVSGGAGNSGTLGAGGASASDDPTWTIGKIGAALDFDGSDDFIGNIGDDNDLDFADTDDFTIEAWFYRDTFTTDDVIVDKKGQVSTSNRPGYSLWIEDGTDDIRFQVSESSGDGNSQFDIEGLTAITSTGWHHVAVVFDQDSAANSTIYLDGVDDKESTTGTIGDVGSLANVRTFRIGMRDASPNDFFDGKIDDVKVFKYARTPAEVAWSYNRGGPVGWWRMDEAGIDSEGETITDVTGNGNAGTLFGDNGVGDNGTGMDCTVAGKRNTACDFDGTDDYISAGDINSLDGLSQLTIGAWVNVSTLENFSNVVSKFVNNTDGGWGMEFGGAGAGDSDDVFLWARSGGGDNSYGYTTGNIISTGVWNHWVMVYDGTQTGNSNRLLFYFNGKQQTLTFSGTIPATIASTTANVRFAANDEASPIFFDGQIDEVKIFNYALTAQQVRDIFNSGAIFYGPSEGSP